MQYRKFGKHDFMVSALGFGTMRLPIDTNSKEGKEIDEAEAIKMIRFAIDNGVNYIDTAYTYHSGKSEIVVGKALKDGYRSKARIATKSPVWLIKDDDDFDRMLNEQLEKLQTDCIDYYLLHSLSLNMWNKRVLGHNVLDRAENARKAGKIKYLGFSFHDSYEAFVQILDDYDKWDFCQIQYNFLGVDYQAGMKGLKYASSKGLAVVIMEPLLGGRLAKPPKDVKAILEEGDSNRTPAEWGLQWLWNQPEISVVLSGMNNMRQVEENINSAERSRVGSLSQRELKVVEKAVQKYKEREVIPCTACDYCMPCPHDVNIPRNFALYNEAVSHDDLGGAKYSYSNFFAEKSRASSCMKCKLCEEKCPQNIPISEWLEKVNTELT
ncbi:MAG: aldo/keto reductase [Eubacteriales bacterium]|nr:aldo/keto reductase [Eubacteriales bacterium]